jgi:hypothetical protein
MGVYFGPMIRNRLGLSLSFLPSSFDFILIRNVGIDRASDAEEGGAETDNGSSEKVEGTKAGRGAGAEPDNGSLEEVECTKAGTGVEKGNDNLGEAVGTGAGARAGVETDTGGSGEVAEVGDSKRKVGDDGDDEMIIGDDGDDGEWRSDENRGRSGVQQNGGDAGGDAGDAVFLYKTYMVFLAFPYNFSSLIT